MSQWEPRIEDVYGDEQGKGSTKKAFDRIVKLGLDRWQPWALQELSLEMPANVSLGKDKPYRIYGFRIWFKREIDPDKSPEPEETVT